ncbi:MAG: ABC transporter ATP-binding protein [Proteobacteria bacterium]|nr:ABC transporter ATP-binding protein [Pseudomonadota bacterium]
MLELRNVTRKVSGETYVDDISLTLQRGELNILLGPNLAGKTSLMRLMAGLDKPDSGSIDFDGTSVIGVPVQRRKIAMVYQQFINYPTLTVYDNIASPMTVIGRSKADIKRRVNEVAELLDLKDFLGRTPDTLSGGQQQRVALARALAKDADLVLLDEPLANLDFKLREELRAELPELFAEMGSVFVYATSEPTEALILGGNTACLHEGRLVQFGATLDSYRQPAVLQTAKIFSDPPLNTIDLQCINGKFHLADSGQVLPLSAASNPDGNYTLGIRPHHLTMRAQQSSDIELSGKVSVTELSGSESYVHFDFFDEDWVALLHGINDLAGQQPVNFFVQQQHALLFDAQNRFVSSIAGAGR